MANRVPPTIALRCCPLFITAELACERVHIVAHVFGLRLISLISGGCGMGIPFCCNPVF
jgi:hypothetical protein